MTIEITADEADAYGLSGPVYRMTVLGDCGIVHGSFEEWVQCKMCSRMLYRASARGQGIVMPVTFRSVSGGPYDGTGDWQGGGA